jgi:uncharacterized protein
MNLIMSFVLALSAQDFPDHTGFVNDFAGVIDAESKQKLDRLLGDFAKDRDTHLIIATVKTLGGRTVEDYTNQLFKRWKVGERGKNNGILFLNAPTERKLRIEVGYGLEGRLTDIDTKMILDQIVKPEFKAGHTGEGFLKGSRAIIEKMTATRENQAVPIAVVPPKGGMSLGLILVIVAVIVLVVALIIIVARSSSGSSTMDDSFLGGFLGGMSSSSGGGGSSWGGSSGSSDSSSSDSSGSFSGGDSGGGGASSDY